MVTLSASRPFRCLNPEELSALARISQERSFTAGQVIFKEGDKGDGVYVVKNGLIEISVALNADVRKVFSQVEPGDLFGEMAVLEFKPRSATATAVKDSAVYFIPRQELLVMVERSSALSLELLRQISQRLREFNQRYIQEMLQAERLAVIGRFARSIVHDLKNPLNIIGITSELASMPTTPEEMRRKARDTIGKQVDRINELVSEILEFTQGSRANVVLASVDFAGFMAPLLDELRTEVELRGSRLEVSPLPDIQAPLDPKRLRRVFHNLVRNATDAMPDGGVVTVRCEVKERELITCIEDSGPGIAPEIADRLFEAFATFGKAHGTGLGLSICKKITEDHGGRIWAANAPGKGARFCFALPLAGSAR